MLDKEIQTLQPYVDMEILRFDSVFQYTIEVDKELLPETVSIPSMLLQPYVENAIWHGLLHKEEGEGRLWIRCQWKKENLLIAEVEDNGVGRQKAGITVSCFCFYRLLSTLILLNQRRENFFANNV